jgi:CRISPR-associated endoribonuclease Cas6
MCTRGYESIIINVSTCRTYVALRILLGLEALNDQTTWDNSQYRKVQGFVYDKLIANTEFKDIHNLKSYKLFCFSNIFPLGLMKRGQLRHLLFSSPNNDLVKSVFSHIKENLMDNKEIDIGEQQYHIRSLELLDTRIVSNRCVIRTSTPVSVRIPQQSYSHYNISKEEQKEKFMYYRSNLPQGIFLTLIMNNMKSKYEYFYKRHIDGDIESMIDSIIFLKEVVIHLPIEDYTIKVPASFWRFYFNGLDTEFKKRFLNFILDVGIGERNSAGLGFLNVEEGARTVRLARM